MKLEDLKVYCFFDDAAIIRYDPEITREFEGDRMKELLQQLGVGHIVIEERNGSPAYEEMGHYDFVFFDYGAVSGMSDYMFQRYGEDFKQAIEECPNTIFVLTSVLGNDWYKYDLNYDSPNLLKCGSFYDTELLKHILELDYAAIRNYLVNIKHDNDEWFMRNDYHLPNDK